MPDQKIRVLIADDHTVVRKGLSALLSAEKYGIEIVGEAANGLQAIDLAYSLQPDVILMDLAMPVKDGLEAIKEIRHLLPQAHLLVLTSFADDEKVLMSLRAGAYGFLLKDASPDELVQTIRSVYANRITLPQELSHILFNPQPVKVKPTLGEGSLTERELDVLRCIGQGMSNKQVAQCLSISIATVRSHVSSMMRKLDLENRTQLAIHARNTGYSYNKMTN